MTKYNVPMTGMANILVEIETEETDPRKIAELAEENVRAKARSRCASESNDSLDLVGEWSPVTDFATGLPEVTKANE